VERVGPQVSLCPPGQNSGISNIRESCTREYGSLVVDFRMCRPLSIHIELDQLSLVLTHSTGSSDERAGAISLHTSAGTGGLPPCVRGHPHHTRPHCRPHRRRPDATATSLGTSCPSYPPHPSSHSPFPPSISSPLPFSSGSLLPPPRFFSS